jgi:hypothetical protein
VATLQDRRIDEAGDPALLRQGVLAQVLDVRAGLRGLRQTPPLPRDHLVVKK